MTTKKKPGVRTSARPAAVVYQEPPREAHRSAAYDSALGEYSHAIELLRRGDFVGAGPLFDRIAAEHRDEPELAERSRTYSRICAGRLDPGPAEPTNTDERYYRAVVLANMGRVDDALKLLDTAIKLDPSSIKSLYARASTWALKGNAEASVADLRQAIAIDPKVRFQASNDPDFERVREEPSFIDLIEPTPAGA